MGEPPGTEVASVERETRDDAAPIAAAAALALAVLALVSRSQGWELVHGSGWWLWLLPAIPFAVLVVVLAGVRRLDRHDIRRDVVAVLLAVIVLISLGALGLLVASLLAPPAEGITGPQLLHCGITVWLTNVVAFGLAFWELDAGGPIRRARTARGAPDFQFPQDENPGLAGDGPWRPRLFDYLYVSLTNSTAFSPTDTLPLTRPAKALMAVESTISIVTLLVVAARAINILD